MQMQIDEIEHRKLLEREQAAKEGEEMLKRIQELKLEERRKLEAKVPLSSFVIVLSENKWLSLQY